MSQAKATYSAAAPYVQYPADQFGVLDVDAAYTTTPGDKFYVGEKVTGGTSGCTARVSGFISATKIRVKGIKPSATAASFSNGETVTGNKSSATAAVGAATLVLANQRKRDIGSGTQTLVYENRAVLTDSGFVQQYWDPRTTTDGRTNTAPFKSAEKYQVITHALNMATSKSQNTDTSVGPTLSYLGPLATAAGVVYSKAAGSVFKFRISSNEAVSVVGGVPAISFSFSAAGASSNAAVLTTQSITVTGATATGGTLVGISSTAGMAVGQRISVATGGTNIVDSIIASIVSGTSVTITTTGTPSGTVTALTVSNIVSMTSTATYATVNMAVAPNYKVGQVVAVAGLTTGGFNNATATVTWVSANGKSWRYANATGGAVVVGTGTAVFNALQYATMTSNDSNDMYFEYQLTGPEATGALSGTTGYVANSAVVTDVGGSAVTVAATPTWTPVVSGVSVVA